MRIIGNLRETASRFGADRKGGIAIMFGVMSVMLMVGAGFGLNVGQLVLVKSNLQNALDAAVTSTARDLTTGDATEDEAREKVLAFLTVNGGTGFAAADEISLDDLLVNHAKKTLEAEASVDITLAFPMFGIDPNRHVAVESASVYSDKHIEVAMMLDVTGSMKKTWKTDKIGDLKVAASNAVEQLFKNQKSTNPRVRVAIVPYAEGVNTGGLSDTVFVEKEGGRDLPTPIGAATPVSATPRLDNCATERKLKDGTADYSDDSPYAHRRDNDGNEYIARINRDDRFTRCPTAELVPLTTDKQKLLDAIHDFHADGVTAGGIAAQWGYYMLSPKWRSAIGTAGLGDGPADYHDSKVAKVAILMTDGQFNTAFAGIEAGERPQNIQGTQARKNAEAICANMKRDGIDVYTIGFDLNNTDMDADERQEAKDVLKNCASTDTSALKHYYEAADGEELDKAFKTIIANVERLHLTK